MKKREYTLNLVVDRWIVTKDHIENLFLFFKGQFPQQEIILEGDTVISESLQKRKFSDFDSFDNFVSKEVLGLRNKLTGIKISTSYVDAEAYTYVLGDIDFLNINAVFTIIGEGDSTVGKWAQDFYDNLKNLIGSFVPHKEQLEYMEQHEDPSRVVLDYYANSETYMKTKGVRL